MGKDVEAVISYWRDDGSGIPDPQKDDELLLGNVDEDKHTVLVKDMRGAESSYSLDTNGFEVHTVPEKERDTTNEEFIKTQYSEEISQLIKEITGAKNVVVILPLVRRAARGTQPSPQSGAKRVSAPSPRPHADWSAGNVSTFLSERFPELGTTELIENASRWQVLGVWKPIKQVARDPFVIADGRSVPDSDFCDLDRNRSVKNAGLNYTWVASLLKYGKGHRWHYLSDMKPEEVLIFKHFDSRRDVPAWRCAHTSIEIPGTENLPPRESIDVRALVCY